MSRVSDEMEERATRAVADAHADGARELSEYAHAALEAVADELGVPGPFVLSEEEKAAIDRLDAVSAFVVFAAFDRALRTLGPQPAQFTPDALQNVHQLLDTLGIDDGMLSSMAVVSGMLEAHVEKLGPQPAQGGDGVSAHVLAVVDELEKLTKRGGVSDSDFARLRRDYAPQPAQGALETPEDDNGLVSAVIPATIEVRGGMPGEYAGKSVRILVDLHNGEIRFDDFTKELLNLPAVDEDGGECADCDALGCGPHTAAEIALSAEREKSEQLAGIVRDLETRLADQEAYTGKVADRCAAGWARVRELEGRTLNADERAEVDRLREVAADIGDDEGPSEQAVRSLLAIVDKHFPKPAPAPANEPDPVRELLAEMRTNEKQHPRETANLAAWANRLEAALAARRRAEGGEVMGEPNASDREWAYVLDGHDSDRLGTVVLHRLECERAERERVLGKLESKLWKLEPDGPPMDGDTFEQGFDAGRRSAAEIAARIIAKLRQP